MKVVIEEVSNQRKTICDGCQWNSKNRVNYVTLRLDEHCTDCGCNLDAKRKCLSCECPKQFWKAYLSQEEYNTLNNDLNEYNKSSGGEDA